MWVDVEWCSFIDACALGIFLTGNCTLRQYLSNNHLNLWEKIDGQLNVTQY